MTTATVHGLCVALVALDFVARSWRTQLFAHGLGHRLPFREALVQSALGETAAALTPMRAGAEPVRMWALGRQGTPARIAILIVGLELVALSAIVLAVAAVLAVTVAPEWWRHAGPGLARSTARGWPWMAAIAAASLAAWVLLRRRRPELLHAVTAELRATRGHLRDVPLWVHLANVPVSLLNIGARVAILPLLASRLPAPPPLAATVVGSFFLLYAQALLPTPAGAGAVELVFLGGAAGNLGAAEAALLGLWRFYTTVLGAAVGVVLASWRFRRLVLPFGKSP